MRLLQRVKFQTRRKVCLQLLLASYQSQQIIQYRRCFQKCNIAYSEVIYVDSEPNSNVAIIRGNHL
jgi:hypothetical protein